MFWLFAEIIVAFIVPDIVRQKKYTKSMQVFLGAILFALKLAIVIGLMYLLIILPIKALGIDPHHISLK